MKKTSPVWSVILVEQNTILFRICIWKYYLPITFSPTHIYFVHTEPFVLQLTIVRVVLQPLDLLYCWSNFLVFEASCYFKARKFSPPTGGFFLASVEGWRTLRAQKLNLADGRTDRRTEGRTTGLRELDMMMLSSLFSLCFLFSFYFCLSYFLDCPVSFQILTVCQAIHLFQPISEGKGWRVS